MDNLEAQQAKQAHDYEVFTAFMRPFIEEMNSVSKAVAQLAESIERNRVVSPWIDDREVALLLGIRIKESGYHVRKISDYINKGLITKFKEGKPRMYWRTDIQALASKIAEGKVNYL